MGIYLPNMEMPKSCLRGGCPLDGASCHLWEEKHWQSSAEPFLKRHPKCPLVPVPPHGRLIDADAFCEKILEIVERQKYDDFYAKSFSVGAILREVVNELKGVGLDGFGNAPTIIEAEEGEDD